MVSADGVYAWLGVPPSPFYGHGDLDLVTSPLVSPLVLACVRLVFAVYTLGTAVAVLVVDSVRERRRDAGGWVVFSCFFLSLFFSALFFSAPKPKPKPKPIQI
jgi:hypothetical protein